MVKNRFLKNALFRRRHPGQQFDVEDSLVLRVRGQRSRTQGHMCVIIAKAHIFDGVALRFACYFHVVLIEVS